MGPSKRSSEGMANCELSDILVIMSLLLMGRLKEMNNKVPNWTKKKKKEDNKNVVGT